MTGTWSGFQFPRGLAEPLTVTGDLMNSLSFQFPRGLAVLITFKEPVEIG